MKNTLITLVIAATAISLAGCGQRIKYDEAAVEIIEVGSKAGVQEQEVSSGRYWVAPFSYRYIVKFPTTLQTYTWNNNNGFTFINKDQIQTSQYISLDVVIDPTQADNIVRKYRGSISKGGGEDGYVLDDVINGPVARDIQQAFTYQGVNYTSAQLYADGGRALIEEVGRVVSKKYADDGIKIPAIKPAGVPQLPDSVVASIKGVLQAKTDAARADAELAKTVAEGNKRKAEADATAYSLNVTGQALRANPESLAKLEIERSWGLCPRNAKVCVIGGAAPTVTSHYGDMSKQED